MSTSTASISIFSIILNIARNLISTTDKVISAASFNRQIALIGLSCGTSLFAVLVFVGIVSTFVSRSTGYGDSAVEKAHRNRTGQVRGSDPDFAALALAGTTIVTAIFAYLTAVASTLWTIIAGAALGWISLLVTGGAIIGYLTISDTVSAGYTFIYRNLISPLNSLLMTIVPAGAIAYQAFMVPFTAITRFVKNIPYRLLNIFLLCTLQILPTLVMLVMDIVYQFTLAITQWITSGVFTSEIPLLSTMLSLTRLIGVVGTVPIECSCKALKFIVGGFTQMMFHPTLAEVITNAINFVWVTASQVFIVPIGTLFLSFFGPSFIWPNFIRPYQLYLATIDGTGLFLQNSTIIWSDIVIAGGNGTIYAMVNGSLPMPTDELAYYIRFLQSQFVRGPIRFVNLITLEPIWQTLIILQNWPLIPTPTGYQTVFNFNEIYAEGLFVASATGTILDTLGQCSLPGYPVTTFGQLSAILTVGVRVIYSVFNVVIGELYWTIYQQAFGLVYMRQYILTDPTSIQCQIDVDEAGIAVGCLFAWLDVHFGTTVQGIFNSASNLILVVLTFLGSVRIIFNGASASIFSAVQLPQLRASLNQITTIGLVLFQFEPGADDITCPTRLTFFCNAGLLIQGLLEIAADLIVTVFEIFILVVQWVTGLVTNNNTENIQLPPSVTCDPGLVSPVGIQIPGASCPIPIIELAYTTACHFGVVLANMFPLDIGCLSGVDNACEISQYPNVRPNTFVKCSSTFACAFGRLPVAPFDFFLTIFNWVTEWIWNGGSFITEANKFVVNVLKKLLFLVVWSGLAFVCPFGHMLDCLQSIILLGGGGDRGNMPVSSIVCLFTAFLVIFTRDMADFILSFINFFFLILSVIFGVGVVGSSASNLGQIISDFFLSFFSAIEKILLLFLTTILSGLFKLFGVLCDIANAFWHDFLQQPAIDCTSVDSAYGQILDGLNIIPLESPINRNYKRDEMGNYVVIEEEGEGGGKARSNTTTKTQPPVNCQSPFKSEAYADLFYNKILLGVPAGLNTVCLDPLSMPPGASDGKTSPKTQPPPSLAESFLPNINGPSSWGSFERDTSYYTEKRSVEAVTETAPHLAYNILTFLRHFGSGVEDPNLMPEYLANNVYWATGSDCELFFNQVKSRQARYDMLSITDQLTLAKCVRGKAIAIGMAGISPMYAWIPEDIIYNPLGAFLKLVARAAEFTLILIQYATDKYVNPRTLLNHVYQARWQVLQMNVAFYNQTFLPLMYGVTEEEGLRLVKEKVGNLTMGFYFKLNFPDVFNSSSVQRRYDSNSSVVAAFKSLLDYADATARNVAEGKGLYAARPTQTPIQEYLFWFNFTDTNPYNGKPYYEKPQYVVVDHVYRDFHNKTELKRLFGNDVYGMMESFYTKKAMYSFFGTAVDVIHSVVTSLGNGTLVEFLQGNRTAWETGKIITRTFVDYWNAASPDDKFGPAKRDVDPTSADKPSFSRRSFMGAPDVNEYVDAGFINSAIHVFSTASRLPMGIIANGSRVVEGIQKSIAQRLEDLYSSPAYEKEVSAFGAMVASAMSAIHKVSLAPSIKTPPPWCVSIAARAHNITFKEARGNITVQDCMFYEHLQVVKENITYNAMTKKFYKRMANGELAETRYTLPPQKGFWDTYFPALNDQAKKNREAIPRIFTEMSDAIWAWAYVFVGANGTALDRIVESSLNLHPSFGDTIQVYNVREEALKLLPAARQQQMRNQTTIRWDDHDYWQAWKNAPRTATLQSKIKELNEAAMFWKGVYDQKFHAERAFDQTAILDLQRCQQQFLNPNGKTWEHYAEEFNKALEQKIRMMTYARNLQTHRNNEQTLTGQAVLMSNVPIPFAYNLSQFTHFECQSTQPWLCEWCYAADIIVGKTTQISNFLIEEYTDRFPLMVNDQIFIMEYFANITSLNTTAPVVYIGNSRTMQPRLPNLGHPIGDLFLLTQDEIDNGINIWRWAEVALNVTLTEPPTNGSFCEQLANYNFADSVANSPTSNFFMALAQFIQYDIGFNICGYIDMIQVLFNNNLSALGTWAVNTFGYCNYSSQLTCEIRNYSLAAGIYTWFIFAIYPTIALTIAFMFLGSISFLLILAFLGALATLFLVIVYNYSLGCFPILPTCFLNDLIKLWVYSPLLGGPCSIIVGSTINSTNYNNLQCADPNQVFTYANGADLGFTNPRNVINYMRTAFNSSGFIIDFTERILDWVFGTGTPTFDYSDYYTDEIRHSNYYYFGFWGMLGTGALALLIIFLGSSLGFSLVVNSLPLFTAFSVAYYAVLRFMRSLL